MNSSDSSAPDVPNRPLRWWPASLITILSAIALSVVWLKPARQRQDRLLQTFIVGFWMLVLLFLWAVLFSRLKPKVRLCIFLVVLAVGVAGAALFQIRGVTGDLRPIVEFRWKPRSSEIVAPATHAAATPAVMAHTNRYSFPSFMGPHRNGLIEGLSLDQDWNSHPPKTLWRHALNGAWSGFAISGNYAVTQEQRGEHETIVCYDLFTGAQIWFHEHDAHYSTTIAGEGPRSTPAISNNFVVAAGGLGQLSVLELQTGKLLWTTNAVTSNGGHLPEWGYACSPLISGDKIIVTTGGDASLAAYSLTDGRKLWICGSGGPEYSSPIEAQLLGIKQIIIFQNALRACTPDGKMLWEHKWPGGHPHISLPIQLGEERLLVSSGYGTGCELLKFTKDASGGLKPERVWKSIALKSKFGPLLVRGDYVYGLDDGIFTCVDLKTGERKWKDGRYGHGQGLLVNDLILFTTESGDVVLIRPSSEKLDEAARLKVFSDKTWNPPALAGPYLLVRNEREAACFELPLRASKIAETSH